MRTSPSPGVRRRLALNPPGLFPFELVRMLDHELGFLGSRLRLVENDFDAAFYGPFKYTDHLLPAMFVGAEYLFGRSSKGFDPDKGSFRFPLWLSANREGTSLPYVLDLRDLRGTVEVVIARLQPNPVNWLRDRPLAPIESEISSKEIGVLISAVLDFVSCGGLAIMPKTPAFYRSIRSDCMLYGCRSGEAFQTEFESREAYEGAERAIARDLADGMNEQVCADIEMLLGDFGRAELRSP